MRMLLLGMIIIFMTTSAVAKEEEQKHHKKILSITNVSRNKLIRYFSDNDNYFLIERDEDEAIFGIHSGYEKRGPHIFLWTVYVFNRMVEHPVTKAAYVKVYSDISCDAKTISFLRMIFYDSKHTVIKVLDNSQYDYPKNALIVPDMLDAVLYNAACPSTSVNSYDVMRDGEAGGE